MSTPKLSIALTTYNQEKFIVAALESILSQETDFEFELVIGEDHSTDDTGKIIEEYKQKHPSKIKLIRNTANLGYVKNFDATLRACTGEYIAIFDGDDIMLPGKLKKQVEFMDRHPEYVMAGHDVRMFDDHSRKTIRIIKPIKKKEFYTIEDLIIYGSFFANCSKIFRRSHLPDEKIDHGINIIADWFITMMIVDTGNIGYQHEIMAEYRVHQASIMSNLKGKQDYDDKMVIFEKLNKKYDHRYEKLFNNQLAYSCLFYGIDELNIGNISSARQKFARSIKQKINYSGSQYFYLIASLLPGFLRRPYLWIKKILPKSDR